MLPGVPLKTDSSKLLTLTDKETRCQPLISLHVLFIYTYYHSNRLNSALNIPSNRKYRRVTLPPQKTPPPPRLPLLPPPYRWQKNQEYGEYLESTDVEILSKLLYSTLATLALQLSQHPNRNPAAE